MGGWYLCFAPLPINYCGTCAEVTIFVLSIIRIVKLSARGSSPTPLVSVILRDGG